MSNQGRSAVNIEARVWQVVAEPFASASRKSGTSDFRGTAAGRQHPRSVSPRVFARQGVSFRTTARHQDRRDDSAQSAGKVVRKEPSAVRCRFSLSTGNPSSFSAESPITESVESLRARCSGKGHFSSRYERSRFNSHGKAIRSPHVASRRQLAGNATAISAMLCNCSI